MAVNVRALVASTLTALLVGAGTGAGCTTSSIAGCDPDSEEFDVDAPVTEEVVTSIMQNWGHEARGDVTCEQLCQEVYRDQRGWETSNIRACTHELNEEAGETPETEVGTVRCDGDAIEYYCEGRRPLGHVEFAAPSGAGPLAEYYGRCAYLEAASVLAFEQLADQLEGWGAPAELVQRCRAAADQERTHANVMGRLARDRGVLVPAPTAEVTTASILEVAVHNATEGCVSETWAGLLAELTSRTATDPELRAAQQAIADDELGHGQLAWDVHAWLIKQLTDEERAEVERRQRAAIAGLPRVAARQGAGLPRALGLPAGSLLAAIAEEFGIGLGQAA